MVSQPLPWLSCRAAVQSSVGGGEWGDIKFTEDLKDHVRNCWDTALTLGGLYPPWGDKPHRAGGMSL